jgi:hypothetical protein
LGLAGLLQSRLEGTDERRQGQFHRLTKSLQLDDIEAPSANLIRFDRLSSLTAR